MQRLPPSVFTSLALLAIAPMANAQVPTLRPGTMVATTWGAASTRTIYIVDPLAANAQALPTALPLATEVPFQPFVEGPLSFLVGTNAGTGQGKVYRASWSATGWTAQQLNTQPIPTQPWSVVRIGGDIFVLASGTGSCTSNDAAIWRLPAAGGAPVLYVALGQTNGAVGLGLAMVAVGQVLHVFTFDTCGTGPEHWSIDTTTTPPGVQRRTYPLPSTQRTCPTWTLRVCAVQADYDPQSGLIVVAGRVGDVLWCAPTGGVVKHLTLPVICPFRQLLPTEAVYSLALDHGTGAIVLGDGNGDLEIQRCIDGAWTTNFMTLGLPGTAIAGLSQVPLSSGPTYLRYAKGRPAPTARCAGGGSSRTLCRGQSTRSAWSCRWSNRRSTPDCWGDERSASRGGASSLVVGEVQRLPSLTLSRGTGVSSSASSARRT